MILICLLIEIPTNHLHLRITFFSGISLHEAQAKLQAAEEAFAEFDAFRR